MKTALEIATRTIQLFEDLRLEAYDDKRPDHRLRPGDKVLGTLTLGWGRTRGVRIGDTCTREQADRWLGEDLDRAASDAYRAWAPVAACLPYAQAALWSYAFNAGTKYMYGRYKLGRALRGQGSLSVPEALQLYVYSGGVEMPGLVKRREVEAVLWQLPEILRLASDPGDLSWRSISHNFAQRLQALLFLAGHDPGEIDGQVGPKTAGALGAFRARVGLPADSTILGTVEALGIEIAGIDIDQALDAAAKDRQP